MKLYLAGPMRGYPENNYPEFLRMAVKLRAAGHDVFSPHETFCPQTRVPFCVCMSLDLTVILVERRTIAALTGWEKSVGAQYELAIARVCGINVVDAYTLELLNDKLDVSVRVTWKDGKPYPPKKKARRG